MYFNAYDWDSPIVWAKSGFRSLISHER
jgi:hypothetical protein